MKKLFLILSVITLNLFSQSTVVPGKNGGTGIANTGKTITIGGNILFNGLHTFQGNLRANTNINFPSSGSLLDSLTAKNTYMPIPSGTLNYIPKFLSSTTIGNSLIFDNGTDVTINTTYSVIFKSGGQVFAGSNNNLFVGNNSGMLVNYGSGGDYNTSLGVNSMSAVTTGNSNTGIGAGSLYSLTTGVDNTAIGDFALNLSTTGGNNTAVGTAALAYNITGALNTAIGRGALKYNLGDGNTSVGYLSLADGSVGSYNTGLGTSSLQGNNGGIRNTALGYFSMVSNTTGIENTASGNFSLLHNTSGSYNVAIGSNALNANTTGSSNVAIGESTLYNSTSNYNVAIGNGALGSNSTGTRNVAIGFLAGYYETGSNKLFIDNTNRASESDGRRKALVYGIFGTDSTDQSFRINGTLQITGGLPGNGKVFTSDANGLGSWQSISSDISATSPLSISTNTISISQSNTSTNGYLSSTDWNTFNGKENVLTFNTGLSRSTNTISLNLVAGTGISVSTNTISTSNIPNSSLANSTFTVNGTGMALGTSSTVTAAAGTLTGTALNSSIVTSSLTTVGTLTTGTWNATAIGATYGGNGQTSVTTGDLLYGSATNTWSKLADVAAGSYLRSGGTSTAPLWSTLTLPNSATANQLMYASGTNTAGFASNATFDNTNKRFLVGSSPSFNGTYNCFSSVASGDSYNFVAGNSASTFQTGMLLYENNSTHYATFVKLNSGVSGNFGGTSFAYANSFAIQNGGSSTDPIAFQGLPIANFAGATTTNYGNRLDASGFRVDQIQNLHTTNNNPFTVNGKSYFGANSTATALIHLAAGTASANTAPLKFTSGTNLTTTEAGAVEYNGTHLYFTATNSGTRYQLDQQGVSNYAHNISTPTTGGTVNLVANQYNIINPAGALLALTVSLPSSPANNDVVYIKYTQNITTVTYSNGTVADGITAPTAGGLVLLVYDSGTSTWY